MPEQKTSPRSTRAKPARLKRDRSGGNRLASSIYEDVRNRICLLTYPPGHVLREIDLTEEFGVSRTPVRQMLQRLEIEGYVETRNGVGTIVTSIDIPAFRDVYDMRLKLAELIGQMKPVPADEKRLATIRTLLVRARQLNRTRDPQEFWQINLERHGVVLSLIGNTALRELYDGYYFRTSRVWYLVIDQIWENQVDALCAELSDLERALEFGDARSVSNVECNHLIYYLSIFERFNKT